MTDDPTNPVSTPVGRLKGFWEGDFTLGPDPDEPAPGPSPALDELAGSGIRIGGRDLTAVLAPAYRKLVRPAD